MTLSASEGTSLLQTLSSHLANAVEQAGRSVLIVNGRQRMSSSGIHWRPGLVITADHTLKRDDEITVTLPDQRTVPVTLVGRDASTDLALLKFDSADSPTAELGDAAQLQVGQMVLALGRSADSGLSASWGVVSSLGGAWRTWGGGQIDQFVRPDLAFYPGFSGGPLVNAQGQVVGLNTLGLARRLGLTIPLATIERVVDQLLKTGHIARGYLGVGMQPVRLPNSLQSELKLSGSGGVIVVSVEAGSPAEQAGLLLGDILITLDGSRLSDTGEVIALLGPDQVGKTVSVRLIRGGAPLDLVITIGERQRK
ncbi:S1C family serine protease [Leptolyngbya sp. FACHB-261]|uniref:S1C family serine protease n=1 Tax=Leptolyngbya sp. FACHB-261 TaxID=2692806 RepID=UPI0016845090|nr:trypsin-like peptidase domain-containing protein [Leptolyngbya sp. FACHB-261]MBD2099896.1 trypsin-like peptidase domain-containing protein [Leptolyngbya sp. FACHB-261]